MKWYKRLSNGLIAFIVVAVLVVVVFLATVIIVPRVRQNYAAAGFFSAVFKDQPRDEDFVIEQDRKTGLITISLDSPSNYSELEVRFMLLIPSEEHSYNEYDVLSYLDENELPRKEQVLFKFKNVKKGENLEIATYQPNEETLKNHKKYRIMFEVIYYK